MVRIYYRTWHTRGLYANSAAFRRTILEGMNQEVHPLLRKHMAMRTAGWANPVTFNYISWADQTGIWVRTFPDGGGAKYWNWVSRGVKGHPISPRNKWSKSRKGRYRSALALYHYVPFTTPSGGYGGPGVRTFSGYVPFVKWWPGIAPRYFEERVVEEVRGMYYNIVENLIRRAVRVAQREGK